MWKDNGWMKKMVKNLKKKTFLKKEKEKNLKVFVCRATF